MDPHPSRRRNATRARRFAGALCAATIVAVPGCSASTTTSAAESGDAVTVETSRAAARAQYDANVAFVEGYRTTERVDLKTGAVSREGAAGSIFYSVPVAIRATATDGSERVFSGCYTMRQLNAQVQEPPFRPIVIEQARLEPSSSELAQAVPGSCGCQRRQSRPVKQTAR